MNLCLVDLAAASFMALRPAPGLGYVRAPASAPRHAPFSGSPVALASQAPARGFPGSSFSFVAFLKQRCARKSNRIRGVLRNEKGRALKKGPAFFFCGGCLRHPLRGSERLFGHRFSCRFPRHTASIQGYGECGH